jgi:hypothetical protein
VTELESKQIPAVTAVQSKNPFRIVRSATELEPADPIPDVALSSAKEPLRIVMCEITEVPSPDPIAGPSNPATLIFPPEIFRLVTLDMPAAASTPAPIPGPPFEPIALMLPPNMYRLVTVDLLPELTT